MCGIAARRVRKHSCSDSFAPVVYVFRVLSLIHWPRLLLPVQVVASDGVRAMMESALTARDRVGVQDFVLLENYTSEAAFIENLRKRFKENLIYVSETFVDKAFPVDPSAQGLTPPISVQTLSGVRSLAAL